MRRAREGSAGRGARGFTLVELVVATGLASLLLVALFRLLDVTLDLWARGETRRALVERATATLELLCADLRSLHSGAAGDLLVEWAPFDADGDGRVDRLWPRLRLVRDASVEDLARLAARAVDPLVLVKAAQLGVEPGSLLFEDGKLPPAPVENGLVQVAWAVLPAGGGADGGAEGVLVRGEQRVRPDAPPDVFEPGFFATSGQPRAGATHEVTRGVLWLGVQLATQTTVLWEGWNLGRGLADSCASWDAWNRGRPDPEAHGWNEPSLALPVAGRTPVLPRRVRLELEFEGERERLRRPRLAHPLEQQDALLELDSSDRAPDGRVTHVLVGAEWMEVLGRDEERLQVRRAARGTEAVVHEGRRAGALGRDGRGRDPDPRPRRRLEPGRPPMRTASRSAGFTLIEVVLAMGLLVFGMSILISLLTFGAALTRSSALRTVSAATVEAVLADLEDSLFPLGPDGTVGEPGPIVERPVPGAPGVVYTALARENPDDPLEYRVDVELAWDSAGMKRAATFHTLLLREVPFGERMRRRFVEGAPPPPPAGPSPSTAPSTPAAATPRPDR